MNIWFIGYYNNPHQFPSSEPPFKTYVGKSLCFAEDNSSETNVIDKINLLFDTRWMYHHNDTSSIFTYFEDILTAICVETGLISSVNKYKNAMMFGVKLDSFTDYIRLASIYHLYKFKNAFKTQDTFVGIKDAKVDIEIDEIVSLGKKWFTNKEDFLAFVK